MPSPRKYMLWPGFIISRNDGQRHYIGEHDLVRLYGVDPSECVVSTPANERWHNDLIRLRPRFDGDYRLPVTLETMPCEPEPVEQTEPASIVADGLNEGCSITAHSSPSLEPLSADAADSTRLAL